MHSTITATIYGLYDPAHPDEMRYIGKTGIGVVHRFAQHRRTSRRRTMYIYCWWRSIAPREPSYVVLAQKEFNSVDEADIWMNEQEIALHKAYKDAGHPLTNLTEGGDGSLGHIPSKETRSKMRFAKLGEKHPCAIKLTKDQVLAILADTRTQLVIANEYGVAQSTISRIKSGNHWHLLDRMAIG